MSREKYEQQRNRQITENNVRPYNVYILNSCVLDEYTKITTPRQDVLFKKGYLTRRKVPETISENSVDQNNDGEKK